MSREKKEKKYRYSEIFGKTIQGEGLYTGVTTSWVRFFGCNLECNGFGQIEPTNPETYELPYQKIDLTDITHVTDLPVFDYGCDSSYSWSKKFRHLSPMATATEIANEIKKVTASEFNPDGLFAHPSGQHIHMCFTGGEPIMSQHALIDILQTQKNQGNLPNYVTVETNGTQDLKQPIKDMIANNYASSKLAPEGVVWPEREWFWSVSPKLFTTSGEKNENAIKPEVVAEYYKQSNKGQLKFVVNGSQATWDELDRVLELYREVGVDWDVWIMPVGATSAGQENIQAKICEQTFDRGFYFAPRVHAWVFDNVIGK